MSGEGGDRQDAATWSPINSSEWYDARDATAALRDVLIAAGMQEGFPYLRADLNAFGRSLIELGRVSPATAERLAELLRLALSCQQDTPNADGTGDRSTDSPDRKDGP